LVSSLGGKQYAACQTDDQTYEVITYFIAKKSEVFKTYNNGKALIKTQHNGAKIELLCSDCGGEFLSDKFKDHLAKRGMKHDLTMHDSPQQDGVSKQGMYTYTEHISSHLVSQDTLGLELYLYSIVYGCKIIH
jgi:hypothetical protein